MGNPTISVIVPVYNVECYLEKCLMSLINQSFDDYEVIVVNDGSTDNSGTIARKIASDNKKIRYIEKKNGGLSDARNVGILNSKGEYLVFVDSDDYVDSDYLEIMFSPFLRDDEIDITACTLRMVRDDGTELNNALYHEALYSGVSALKEVLYSRNLECYCCGKIFKKSLFRDFLFTKGRLFEDIDIIYKLLIKARKVLVLYYSGYKYLQREGAITKVTFNKNQLVLIDIMEEMKSYIVKNVPFLINGVYRRMSFSYLWLITKNEMSKNRDKLITCEIHNRLKAIAPLVLKDKESSKKDKLKIILLFVMGDHCFSRLYSAF